MRMAQQLERMIAARKWLDAFAEKHRNDHALEREPAERALMVICLTQKTVDFLAEHDPMALRQAQEALSDTSWQDYL